MVEEVISVTTQINIFSLKLSGKLFIPLPHVPHCGYAEPIAIHLLLPAPVSLTLKPFLVRAVI